MSEKLPALKSCPFCGGAVKLEEAESSRDGYLGERRWWGVVCRNTTNRGGSCAIQQRPSASKEAAIDRWNMRAGSIDTSSTDELTKLRAFAQDIMEGWPDVGTLDGFDLQELAVKHGLLAETTHHKPCAEEGCNCASMVDERDWKEGVQCYRGTALLKGAP